MKRENLVEKILFNILEDIKIVLMLETGKEEEEIINRVHSTVTSAIKSDRDLQEKESIAENTIEQLFQGEVVDEKKINLTRILLCVFFLVNECYGERLEKELCGKGRDVQKQEK